MTPPAAVPATLTAAYEQLRAWAGGQAPPGPRPVGLALLLQRGLAAWLAATMTGRPPATRATVASPVVPADPLAAVPAGAVTDVLATMVAAWQQEVSR